MILYLCGGLVLHDKHGLLVHAVVLPCNDGAPRTAASIRTVQELTSSLDPIMVTAAATRIVDQQQDNDDNSAQGAEEDKHELRVLAESATDCHLEDKEKSSRNHNGSTNGGEGVALNAPVSVVVATVGGDDGNGVFPGDQVVVGRTSGAIAMYL